MSTTVKRPKLDLSTIADMEIEPVPVSPLYRIGLALVAVAMILLPMVYLAMIAALAWATYHYAVDIGPKIFTSPGGGARGKLIGYCVPIFAGCVLLLFMVKPLLARRGKSVPLVEVDPAKEQTLAQFVTAIARLVGAPAPRSIRVDCRVNASASFRRGLVSFLGNDLTLTLGLPLLAGMSVRQLAAVVAHEFGHFSQGGGMRLTYLIESVNFWFYRVATERDRWDERLTSIGNAGGSVAIAVAITRGLVWLTRRVLWVLMYVGRIISCFVSRQMEYDADRYSARVAGSDSVASIMATLTELSLAEHKAHSDLGQAWQERRLCDNLPALVGAAVKEIPAEVLQKVRADQEKSKTALFASHPCERDRIASVQRDPVAGIIRSDAPALCLLAEFDALAAEASLHLYQHEFGLKIDPGTLVSTEQLLQDIHQRHEAHRAVSRYFQDTLTSLSPLRIPPLCQGMAANAEKLGDTIMACRAAVTANAADAKAAAKDLGAAMDHSLVLARATTLRQAGYVVKNAPPAPAVGVEQATQRVRDLLAPSAQRLDAAMMLLSDNRFAADIDGEDYQSLWARAAALVGVLNALAGAHGLIAALYRGLNQLHALLTQKDRDNLPNLVPTAKAVCGDTQDALRSLRRDLASQPYPFKHAKRGTTLGEFMVPEVPQREAYGQMLNAADAATTNYINVYFAAIGELAGIAEIVEKALGLDPLPEPPAEKQEEAKA